VCVLLFVCHTVGTIVNKPLNLIVSVFLIGLPATTHDNVAVVVRGHSVNVAFSNAFDIVILYFTPIEISSHTG